MTVQYTTLSLSAGETSARLGYMLSHKASLNILLGIEISLLFGHKVTKLEISNRSKFGKIKNVGKLNNTFLKD